MGTLKCCEACRGYLPDVQTPPNVNLQRENLYLVFEECLSGKMIFGNQKNGCPILGSNYWFVSDRSKAICFHFTHWNGMYEINIYIFFCLLIYCLFIHMCSIYVLLWVDVREISGS